MRFSTRVLLVLLGAAILTHGVLFVLVYRSARNSLFEELRVQVANIAATGALTIDAAAHERVTGEDSPEYEALVMNLRQIRDANRREDMRVKYVYTARPNPDYPSGFEFVGDAEESAENVSLPGDEFPDLPESLRLDEARADRNFSTDQWGTWLSASAPIRDAAGKPIAVLGVDVSAESVRSVLATLWWQGAGALAIAFLLAVGIAWAIYRWVNRPIVAIEQAVEKVGRGDYEVATNLPRGDEFERLARALESAARALRERETLKENLARVVGDQVAGRLALKPGIASEDADAAANGVALLFAGFHDASAQLAAEAGEDSSALIEELCATVIEGVVEYGGEVAAFHREGLLAVFGGEGVPGSDAPLRAVRAAFKVRKETEKLFWRWMAEGRLEDRPWLGVSVDIPQKSLSAGDTGVAGRIASINGLTQKLSAGVLTSAEIAQAVSAEIKLRSVGDDADGRFTVYGS
ncbi:MAG: HAMP domain-containing protein [Verrucomicrobiae bacterium]|nr:HAMP domain-containing protein [Verrucomicrobiae bacterium]